MSACLLDFLQDFFDVLVDAAHLSLGMSMHAFLVSGFCTPWYQAYQGLLYFASCCLISASHVHVPSLHSCYM